MPFFDAKSVAEWTRGCWKFGIPGKIHGVSTDTRTFMPGNLFVAIKGPRYNGHDFLKQAFERGAAGAVVSDCSAAPDVSHPLLCVQDTADALRDMAACYRRTTGVEVIGVTGSVGKTTVKEMVADVLSTQMPTARTKGNWNNDLGLPLSLLGMEPSTRVGVFEVGTNHPGELRPLCRKLGPDWGLVTTIGPAHLEFFKSVEAIAIEKCELLKSLPGNGVAVLRKDEDWYHLLRSAAPGRVITLALKGDADYVCDCRCERDGRVGVVEQASGDRFSFKLPLPGRHIAENALFAVAVGRGHGLAWEDISLALERFKPQRMRWECGSVGEVMIINDAYNANPMSMAAALRTFSKVEVNGKKWLALGGMLELGEAEHQAHIDLGISVAIGPWAGLIAVGALGKVIAAGAEKGGLARDRVFLCADHAEAAATLRRETSRGDAVLLKASRGEHLEDVVVAWKGMAHE